MAHGRMIDIELWEKFWEYWEDLIEEFPETKLTALEAAGKAALEEVQSQIGNRVQDTHGRVRRWQTMRVGSKGGYVAVSGSDETVAVTASGAGVSAKKVTSYLDQGHGIRKPSGTAKRYVPRIKSGRAYVPGRQFYSWAKMKAAKIAAEAADNALEAFSNAIDEARYGT